MTDQPTATGPAPELAPALQAAQDECAEAGIPWPDDYLLTVSPQSALLILRQASMATLQVVTGAAASLDDDSEATGSPLTWILACVATCVAASTHAMVTLGMLPPEAERGA